jgi:hypothetical protein
MNTIVKEFGVTYGQQMGGSRINIRKRRSSMLVNPNDIKGYVYSTK